MNRLLTVLILLFWPIFSAHATDEYQAWQKKTLGEIDVGSESFAYPDYSKNVRKLLKKRLYEVSNYLAQHSKNPVLWYLKGWLIRQEIYIYIDDSQKSGVTNFLKDNRVQAASKEYQSYYRKALELDDSPDASDHLTVDMLMTISDDVVGDPEIKEKALQKEMALSRAGGFVSENPNYEWETYEVMLENYIQQQDYDNYLKTVNEMIERFPDSSQMDSLLEAKRQAEEAIKQRDNEAATQDMYTQADTYSAPKPAAVEPVKAVESKQIVEPASEPTQTAKPTKVVKAVKGQPAPTSENNTMLWWLLGGGIGLLGVIVLLLRRKQS